jgi:hypothetical protein
MRRLKTLLSSASITAAVLAGMFSFPSQAQAFSGGGAGTPADPYKVMDCAQLQEVGNDLDASYEQTGHIDCGGASLTPIGSSSTPFTGSYDGKGYEISSFTVGTLGVNNIGLFGYIDSATIIDVHVYDAGAYGGGQTAMIVGTANLSMISYVTARSVVVTANGDNTAGLVGQLGGSTISYSAVQTANIIGGNNNTGGLAGYLVGPSAVTDSYTTDVVIDAPSVVGGAAGEVGVGPIFLSRIYTESSFMNAGTDTIGHLTTGYGESATSMQEVGSTGSTYKGTSSVAPFDSWDFDTVWYVRPGTYPGLRPRTMPMMECYESNVTTSTMDADCFTRPALEGDPHWELRYGFHSDTNRTSLGTQAGPEFNVTATNLLPGTDYDIEFRWVDTIGTGPWGKVLGTTTGSSDVDSDGMSNEEEFKAPNDGDADNDGTKDYLQANVTSFKSAVSDNYVTLKTTCTDNFNTQLGAEAASPADTNYNYPGGLIAFVIRGCTAGATVPVTVFYYGSYDTPSAYLARKWQNGVYITIPGAAFSTMTVGGQAVLKMTYTITDGSTLDDDGIADGNIVDPVGFATLSANAPNSGLAPDQSGPLAGFAALCGTLILAFTRRRARRAC